MKPASYNSKSRHLREPGQAVTDAYLVGGVLRYGAEDREIVGRGGPYFGNRPLYCVRDADGVVLAGDRPCVRLLAKTSVLGIFCAGIVRAGRGRWWHACPDVEHRYRCGHMQWRIHDPELPGAVLRLDAVPMEGTAGAVMRLRAEGLVEGDRLVWFFGGAREHQKSGASGFWLGDLREQWDPIYRGNPDVCKTGDPRKPELSLGFMPEWCRGNKVAIDGTSFELLVAPGAPRKAVGKCDRGPALRTGDAGAAGTPAKLVGSRATDMPLVYGEILLARGINEIHWAFEDAPVETPPERLAAANPVSAFAAATGYLAALERVRVDTPEPRLDAAVAAVAHAIDGSCDRQPVLFRHGCMAWSIPFLGWRIIGGATAFGWHDRVRANAAYYLPRQVTDASCAGAEPDPNLGGALQSARSRFWGRGRLAPDDSHPYNTQSQFFDQLIRDWRWTADPGLESMLRPALELHLEWALECFDPDDDGLYESYVNTLPTDSVWYSGGGSVEESAYAFTGHLAARDMALRAGDPGSASRHQARADKIRGALQDRLWLKDRGHFGLYIEQIGRRRVHSDAWVYSQFLPIDAGLVPAEQAAQALYYTEWDLERIRLPFGGELCQPSNWVPSKWSVRDMFGGDMWHLALACAQTGLADEGWELLLGALLESAYAGAVPGGFGQIGAGTDFADNSHMFARAVVEGLFGFDPDYPSNMVRIRPAFPSGWPSASIRTPDFTLDYRRDGDLDRYRVTLARPAGIEFNLPVRAARLRSVELNGRAAEWTAAPGFGCSRIAVVAEPGVAFELVIAVADRLPQAAPVRLKGKVGKAVCLAAPGEAISGIIDPQGALEGVHIDAGAARARLAPEPGHHLVLADVATGELPRRLIFKVEIAESGGKAHNPAPVPGASWRCLDLTHYFNGDVREIFQQKYLAPRPNTCSARLATDGYSAWTMVYWKHGPPVIDLGNLSAISDATGRIAAPNGARFSVSAAKPNIAFTALWENWPRSITVPVNGRADAAWLLVCGFTSPMQTRIANAEFRFRYADSVEETLEIVPPLNFWSLCPWGGIDYSYETDAFCLPPEPPCQVQLGNNCRAIILSHPLRPGVELSGVTLETLSPEVVIGLMGLSLIGS